MVFARRVFLAAGIIGLIIVLPLLFSEAQRNIDYPPAITHPEFYYGFLTVTCAFQLVFLVISRDPVRYRMLMIPSMIEKFPFVIAIVWLYAEGRTDSTMLAASMLDLVWGILFVVSYMVTSPARRPPSAPEQVSS